MLDPSALLSVFAVYVVGVISPGPNFVAVTHRAVTTSRREALSLVAGIVLVNVLWASGALFGIGLLFHLFPWLFWTLKVVGAGYLVWFGWQLLLRAAQPLPERSSALIHQGQTRAFRDGIVTNLTYPKAMAFYASVFSASAPVGASTVTLTAMVAVVAVVASFWYGSVALILSTERVASRYRQSKVWIERGCGAFLVTFGFRQAFSR